MGIISIGDIWIGNSIYMKWVEFIVGVDNGVVIQVLGYDILYIML